MRALALPVLILLTLAECATAAPEAQVYVDLSGEWTRSEDGTPPRPIVLPFASIAAEDTGKPFRLERTVNLPAEGLRGLAVLMTSMAGPYTVRVNGRPVGGYGSPDSWLSPSLRHVVFSVPDGLVRQGDNQIAVEVSAQSHLQGQGRRAGRLPAGGPLLGAETVLQAIAEGRMRTLQLRFVYLPVNCGLQLLFVLILWAMSSDSRYRRALRLMALFFLLQVLLFDMILTLEFFASLSPSVWDILLPLDVLWTAALLTETGLSLAGISVPLAIRAGYYLMMPILGVMGGGYYSYSRMWIPVAVDLWMVWKAWPSRQRLPLQYLALLAGYDFVQAALLPPIELPPMLKVGPLGMHIVPGYRILIGLLFILINARQSARDRSERERLASELEAARAMQQLLLPKSAIDGLEVVYQPAAEVGGDFYVAEPTADGGLLVVVGDVSGKGLKAAMLVSMIVGSLRRQTGAPGAVLARLNDTLSGHTGGGFVTCCCAQFAADGTVKVANAGHLAPYADGGEVPVEAGLPLGITTGETYSESHLSGDLFTFVSDGVVEAANPQGELFGFERTRAISTHPAKEIAAAASAWGQNDDITVLTVDRRKIVRRSA